LNSSGDAAQESTRFWFDTRANLRREMEDRKRRFDDKGEVRSKIKEAISTVLGGSPLFDGVHFFAPHADVPDDAMLRLVVLSPEVWYSREEARQANDEALQYIRNHGTAARHRGNRLLFLAADYAVLPRLREAARAALSWRSIVKDINERRLVVDLPQKDQAERELRSADEVVSRTARECYRWLLCPGQDDPSQATSIFEVFSVATSGNSFASEIERICSDNELVITTWSAIHLRECLKEFYWTRGNHTANASAVWEDSQKYLYLPRLRRRDVLAQTIRAGAGSRDFFGIAYGQVDGKYEGFQFGTGTVQFDDSLILIEPAAARAYEEAAAASSRETTQNVQPHAIEATQPEAPTGLPASTLLLEFPTRAKASTFHASADITASAAKMRLVQLADELIAILTSDANASVRVVLEISADFPEGVPDDIRRNVSENARTLGIAGAEWE